MTNTISDNNTLKMDDCKNENGCFNNSIRQRILKKVNDDDSGNDNAYKCDKLNFGKSSHTLSIDDLNKFVITKDFTEEDFNRPDVPEWFKKEIENPEFNKGAENDSETKKPYRLQIVWRNVIVMLLIHAIGIHGYYLNILYGSWKTTFFIYCIGAFTGLGILVGAHRMWTHRSFQAHWSVRLVLMIAQTMALQNDIYEWTRDHRVHHKYTDTDADPHNSRRGFFFSHVGWLLCRKHPEVKNKGSQVSMSDVWDDPIVRFQRRFYIPLVILFWGAVPTMIPIYFWNETFYQSFSLNLFRYVVVLHNTWLVNSAAHMYGYRFYDRSIHPTENRFVTYCAYGEGYHNYHHIFPWDYSASEHGWSTNFNMATLVIDFCSLIGLAHGRRVVARSLVEKRAQRTGDLSIIPPLMDVTTRKPWSSILDWLIGMIVSTWILWLRVLLKPLIKY